MNKRKKQDLDSSNELENICEKTEKMPKTAESSNNTGRLESLIEQLIDKVDANTEENRRLREDFVRERELWNNEKQDMREEIQKLKRQLEQMDRTTRRNNIIMKGGNLDMNNLLQSAQKLIREKLDIEPKIKQIETVGRSENIFKMEIDSLQNKIVIMRNKHKLKGQGIYIEDDLSKTERNIQYEIRRAAKEERERGKTVKVAYRKMIVGDDVYRWEELESKLIRVEKK